MSVIDILTRVDAICKKYDKYDIERQRETSSAGDDAFVRLSRVISADIDAAMLKSNNATGETNRAALATVNAEIRRQKSALRAEIPKLQKLAVKKVKGLSKEELEARHDIAADLAQRIEDVPDGTILARRPSNVTWGGSPRPSPKELKIDVMNPVFDAEDRLIMNPYYEESAESTGFQSEYEQRRQRQDVNLDYISSGLVTLRDMAGDMHEELDRQVPLVDEIDVKVDKASADLKNTNKRLKEVVTQMRSSRNFCIDVILLIIVLGIAAYLYKILR